MIEGLDFDSFHPESAQNLEVELRSLPFSDMQSTARGWGAQLPELEKALDFAGCTATEIASLSGMIEGLNSIAPAPAEKTPEPAWRGGILTSAEALADELPDAVIEGFVYQHSITNFNGASKGGKSIASTQALMCVAAGVPFLGMETIKSRVLYVSLEMTAAMMVDRMQRIAEDTGVPMPDLNTEFSLWAGTKLDNAALMLDTVEGCEKLEATIVQGGYGMVCIDTYYLTHPSLDSNLAMDMGPFFRGVSNIAQRSGAGVLGLDHVTKGEQIGPVSQSGIGSGMKGGAARTIAFLKREGDGWTMNVESHFGNWDEPISFRRPIAAGGFKGMGCEITTVAGAKGLSLEAVRQAFVNQGKFDEGAREWQIDSQNKLIDALIEEGLVAENARATGQSAVRAIESTYGCDWDLSPKWLANYAVRFKNGAGPRGAKVYRFNDSTFEMIQERAKVA